MTKDEYNEVLESGYDEAQINQLILMDKYPEIRDELLCRINNKCDVDVLRKFNYILKNHLGDIEDDRTMDCILNLVSISVDPMLYFDFTISDYKRNCVYDLLANNEMTPELLSTVECVKYENVNDERAYDIADFYKLHKKDPKIFVKQDFNDNQLNMAKMLFDINKIEYIDKIKDLNKTISSGDLVIEIDSLNLDFVKTINKYKQYEIELLTRALQANIDIEQFITDDNEYKNIQMCIQLVKRNLSADEIKDFVKDFKWRGQLTDIRTCEKIIDAKLNGYEIDKYFSDTPTYGQVVCATALAGAGYSKENIIKYSAKIGMKFNQTMRTCNEKDILKYVDLHRMGINVDPIIDKHIPADILNLYIKHCKNEHDLKEKLEYRTNSMEAELIFECAKNKREDLIPAIIYADCTDYSTYKLLLSIIEKDAKKGTNHDITKLLYDKGFDVFKECEFGSCYEFGEDQKHTLARLISYEVINEEQLEQIRDNRIPNEVIPTLANMVVEGLDVSSIIEKINELSLDDIKNIHKYMNLGFDLKIRDEDQKR